MTGSESSFVEFQRGDLDYPIGVLFERQVTRHPRRIAVKGPRASFTYAQLDAAANGLAQAILARRGSGCEPIALLFDHDAPVLAGILAVLKAGKIYVGLDAHHSMERLRGVVEDSGAPLIVCDAVHRERALELAPTSCDVLDAASIEAGGSPGMPALPVSARAAACISYTSGSTGDAKGVVGDHRAITHRAMVFINGARIGPDDRLALLESVGVGGSFRGIFGALLTGAAVLPFDLRAEGMDALGPWLIREGITICSFAASMFRHFAGTLPDGADLPALRYLGVGREAVSRRDVNLYRARFAPGCVFVNVMGGAEAGTMCEFTIDKTTALDGDVVPVGHPVVDKDIRLLDDSGSEVADGEIGEVVVGSEFLAMGYWRRPDLDAKVFSPDPAGGSARAYHTGDLAKRLPDGRLVHLGRKDARAKLRGRFVDTREIESALLGHPGVLGAAVTLREDRVDDPRLVAYVVTAGAPPSVSELRGFVQASLGEHLVPSAFVFLAALPLTPNGKVDVRALPAPEAARPALATSYVAPRTSVEGTLARMWGQALGVDKVGIHDNIVDLGADSLTSVRLIAEIGKRFGRRLPPATLLQAPTVEHLAAVLATSEWSPAVTSLVTVQAGQRTLPALFCVPGHTGTVLSFQELARQLGPEQPLYGLEPRGLDGRQAPHTRIESMAAAYLEEIRAVQPAGPYFLAGHCMGGFVAFEMAQQLRAAGKEVGLLALFETAGRETTPRRMLDRISRRVAVEHANLAPLSSGDRLVYVATKVGAIVGRARALAERRLGRIGEPDPNLRRLALSHSQASRAYVPRPYEGPMVVFWAQRPLARRFVDPSFGWGDLVRRGLEVRQIRVPEGSLIQNPEAARALAADLAPRLRDR